MSAHSDPSAQPKRLRQPTTYGHPGRVTDPKFYRWAIKILKAANKFLRVIVYVGMFAICGLIVYAGVGVHHADVYVSDGGDFSCKINSIKGTTHGR